MDEAEPSQSASAKQGTYALGYSKATDTWMSQRTASTHAAFFLPHITQGMRLLDCGCGSGSITLGLAAAVAPGNVVGIDIEPLQVKRARERAAQANIDNVQFQTGNVCALPFPDASFDAVFAHAVLYHVAEPLQALHECRRVLRPHGVVGIRDTDYSTWLMEPTTPHLDMFRALSLQVATHNGASPSYARHQRTLLAQAGFGRTASTASCVSRGTLEETQLSAQAHIARLKTLAFRMTALEQRWTTSAELDIIERSLERWGEQPDSFEVVMWRATVGWVEE